MRPLTVLLTNIAFAGRTGTEIVTRNIALKLLARGHRPVVYAPRLGPLANEVRQAAIPVVDNIAAMRVTPDIIHGHHNPTTAAAIARFPATPAIFLCHDFVAWHDQPPALPAIRRYVAVSDKVADRLWMENGIPPEQVQVLLNAIDLDRFQPREVLPERPARALAYAQTTGHLAAIEAACAARDIQLEVVGNGTWNVTTTPETLLPHYDLVFASALSAMEAMASGAAVIICDGRGLAGLVTPERFAEWRRQNFGLRALRQRITPEAVLAEIDHYHPDSAALVTRRLRTEAGLDDYIDQLVDLYMEVLFEQQRHGPVPPDQASLAMAAHLQQWGPRVDNGWPWMREREQLLEQVDRLQLGLETVEIGRTYSFGTPTPWCVPLYGFLPPEDGGMWTTGRQTSLLVRLAAGVRNRLVLEFTTVAMVHRRHPELHVDVQVNGEPTGTWSFLPPNEQELRLVEIPAARTGDHGTLCLHFTVREPRSPQELGISGHARPLGVKLVNLQVRESDASGR